MKKKLFALLAAAVMACCTLAAPTSAAETYQMGDINLDGTVDILDAMLALNDFVETMCENPSFLTKGQKLLGNVNGKTSIDPYYPEIEYIVDLQDAIYLLIYYSNGPLVQDDSVTLASVIGKEPEYDPEIDAFFAEYTVEYDRETDRFVAIEKDGVSK